MENDLEKGEYTSDLFLQYKKHLGRIRYFILVEGQKLIIPDKVRSLLGFGRFSFLTPILPFYKLSKWMHLDGLHKKIAVTEKI